MSLSNTALTGGIMAVGSKGALGAAAPWLIGAGVAGKLIGGLFGKSSASKLGDIQSQMAGVQNQIFAEKSAIEQENLLQRRRNIIRQGQQRQVGLRVAEIAQSGGRSSGRAAVSQQIDAEIGTNVGNIDRAIKSSQTLSVYNQQLSSLQTKAANVQAKQSILSSIF